MFGRLFLSALLLAIFAPAAYSQKDSLLLKGKYYETNLYVFNPSVNDTAYSVYMVVVNNDSIFDELNSNSVEVDFQLLGVKPESDVQVVIYFDSLHPPFVVNPEVLYSPTKFKFSKPRIRKDVMTWRVYGDVSDYPIDVQQFRWNMWRVVAEVDPLDTVENNLYSVQLHPHSGVNTYRLKTINLQEEVVYSKEVTYKPPWLKKVYIKNYKVKDELEFSAETEYEIYDEEGKLITKGTDRYVDVSKLPPGNYWVNYDNSSELIKKKK